jgi:hypothetical protein
MYIVVSILPLSTIFVLDFGTVPTVRYSDVFLFILLCYLFLFTQADVQRDFHVRLCSRRLAGTRRVWMPLLERENADPLGSPAFTLNFSELHVVPGFVLCENFCRRLCVFFSFYYWLLYCLHLF